MSKKKPRLKFVEEQEQHVPVRPRSVPGRSRPDPRRKS